MTERPARPLGARLAASTALVAGLAIALFALVAAGVLISYEDDDDENQAQGESPLDEVASRLLLALGISAPVVLGAAVVGTRRLSRRLTARIDRVIDQAATITHQDLDRRLPVSSAGDEIDAMAAALNGLLDRVDRGLAAQRQFVADASHELRTPLTVLRTQVEVARRHPRTSEEWEALAARVALEVGRMTEMVEALLRLARPVEAARGGDGVDVGAVIDEVVARLRPVAGTGAVRLEPLAASAPVLGDAEALAVAVGNLVKNAIAHSPRGGAVVITCSRVGPLVEIAVEDAGPGVPPDERERIFLPFARGRQSADRRGAEGVGLGLSVARRIVEQHGGALTVGDAAPGGARFVIRLPATGSGT